MRLFNLEERSDNKLFDVGIGNLFDTAICNNLKIGCVVGIIASEKCYHGEIATEYYYKKRALNKIILELNNEFRKIYQIVENTVAEINYKLSEMTNQEDINLLKSYDNIKKFENALFYECLVINATKKFVIKRIFFWEKFLQTIV